MTAPSPLLELCSVGKSYPAPAGSGPLEVVRQIDLTVAAGDFLTVAGPSGSGKSTLLYLIGTLTPPTSGRVLFEVDGVTAQIAREALSLAAAKLPIKTRFVARIAE